MLKNMLMTSVTPLNSLNEINCCSNMPFSVKWPVTESAEMKEVSNRISVKKKKRQRTSFSTQQLQYLEDAYSRQRYINKMERDAITRKLNLGDRQVKIWFQNRRMRSKREAEEKVLCHTSDESINSDATLKFRPLNENHQTLGGITNTFQNDVGAEKSNYHPPVYTPPFEDQIPQDNYYPINWNFQQNSVIGFSGNAQYPTEYYPPHFENHYFQYSAPQTSGTEASSMKDGGMTTTYYYNFQ